MLEVSNHIKLADQLIKVHTNLGCFEFQPKEN